MRGIEKGEGMSEQQPNGADTADEAVDTADEPAEMVAESTESAEPTTATDESTDTTGAPTEAAAERTETTERAYENPDDITIDAERMAKDGWTILSQSEREVKQGCMMKFAGMLFRSKEPNQHVVIYQRTVR
jgi:hypothetical protein